jgi:hypothetical protein
LFDDNQEHPRFAEFWLAYPRRVARRDASEAFTAAVIKRGTDPDVILEGLRRQRFSSDPRWIKHPAAWLNGNRWLDEPEPTRHERLMEAVGLNPTWSMDDDDPPQTQARRALA